MTNGAKWSQRMLNVLILYLCTYILRTPPPFGFRGISRSGSAFCGCSSCWLHGTQITKEFALCVWFVVGHHQTVKFTQRRLLVFYTMIYDEKLSWYHVQPQLKFCQTQVNFGWPMSDGRLLLETLHFQFPNFLNLVAIQHWQLHNITTKS